MYDAFPTGPTTLIRDDGFTSLETLPPDLYSYARLLGAETPQLGPRDLVRVMQSHARQAAFSQAKVLVSLSSISDRYLAHCWPCPVV